MNPAVRLLVAFAIRVSLVFFAGWFALAESALPADVSTVSRMGLAFLFLIAAILVGEVSSLRLHFGMIMGAIRKAKGEPAEASGPVADAADTRRMAVDQLIKALGVTKDDAVRTTVHKNLTRLTGQDLPADATAWETWWAQNRDTFV